MGETLNSKLSRSKLYKLFKILVLVGFILATLVIWAEALVPGNLSGKQSTTVAKIITGDNVAPSEPEYVAATAVSFTLGNVEERTEGKSQAITIYPVPVNATYKSCVWTSSNPSVAKVTGSDKSFSIQFMGLGTCTISLNFNNGEATYTSGVVEVVYPSEKIITSVDADTIPDNFSAYEYHALAPVTVPANRSAHLTWASSNKAVGTISGRTFAALSPGTTVLTGKSSYDGVVRVTKTITVVQGDTPAPATVVPTTTSVHLDTGTQSALGIGLIVSPSAAPGLVTWTSSNTSVVTVSSSGLTTGLQPGTATITVKSVFKADVFATIVVTVDDVWPVVGGLSILGSKQVGLKNTIKLYHSFSNSPTHPEVVWYTSDNTIATVSSEGEVTGVALGKVVISAVSVADGTVIATKIITVKYGAEFIYKVRKMIGHFTAFLVLGILGALTFMTWFRRKYIGLPLCFAAGWAIAAISEAFQLPLFTQKRGASWKDVQLDFKGYCVGVALTVAFLIIFVILYYINRKRLAKKKEKFMIASDTSYNNLYDNLCGNTCTDKTKIFNLETNEMSTDILRENESISDTADKKQKN